MSKHNCDNCGTDTENEPMTLCDECDDPRDQAVTRERDALLDERRLVALELGCGLRVPLPGRLADVAAHFVAQVRIGEARLTRERDEAQAVLRKCHEVAWPRGGDLNGDPVCDLMLMRGTFQAHITTLERERDEALAVIRELRQKLAEAGVEGSPPPWETTIARLERLACEARADAARLREALKWSLDELDAAPFDPDEHSQDAVTARWRATEMARAALASAPIDEPDYSGLCSAPECGGHCGYVHARGCEAIREYLADHGGDPYKAPSRAEPTPRDMRVAEAVAAEAATIVRHPSGPEGEDGYSLDDLAQRIEDLDLAAVVAKAAKAVKP